MGTTSDDGSQKSLIGAPRASIHRRTSAPSYQPDCCRAVRQLRHNNQALSSPVHQSRNEDRPSPRWVPTVLANYSHTKSHIRLESRSFFGRILYSFSFGTALRASSLLPAMHPGVQDNILPPGLARKSQQQKLPNGRLPSSPM